jgi:hypothetical protein
MLSGASSKACMVAQVPDTVNARFAAEIADELAGTTPSGPIRAC